MSSCSLHHRPQPKSILNYDTHHYAHLTLHYLSYYIRYYTHHLTDYTQLQYFTILLSILYILYISFNLDTAPLISNSALRYNLLKYPLKQDSYRYCISLNEYLNIEYKTRVTANLITYTFIFYTLKCNTLRTVAGGGIGLKGLRPTLFFKAWVLKI